MDGGIAKQESGAREREERIHDLANHPADLDA
jgi:hypothetical protein